MTANAMRGKSFRVLFPVVAPSNPDPTQIIPAAELEERLAEVGTFAGGTHHAADRDDAGFAHRLALVHSVVALGVAQAVELVLHAL